MSVPLRRSGSKAYVSGAQSRNDFVRKVRTAESIGYSTILLPDHVFHEDLTDPRDDDRRRDD